MEGMEREEGLTSYLCQDNYETTKAEITVKHK